MIEEVDSRTRKIQNIVLSTINEGLFDAFQVLIRLPSFSPTVALAIKLCTINDEKYLNDFVKCINVPVDIWNKSLIQLCASKNSDILMKRKLPNFVDWDIDEYCHTYMLASARLEVVEYIYDQIEDGTTSNSTRPWWWKTNYLKNVIKKSKSFTRDNNGKTIFHQIGLFFNGIKTYLSELDYVLLFGILNLKDNDGNTPLHVYATNKKIFSWMLQLDIPQECLQETNNAGYTPIELYQEKDKDPEYIIQKKFPMIHL